MAGLRSLCRQTAAEAPESTDCQGPGPPRCQLPAASLHPAPGRDAPSPGEDSHLPSGVPVAVPRFSPEGTPDLRSGQGPLPGGAQLQPLPWGLTSVVWPPICLDCKPLPRSAQHPAAPGVNPTAQAQGSESMDAHLTGRVAGAGGVTATPLGLRPSQALSTPRQPGEQLFQCPPNFSNHIISII